MATISCHHESPYATNLERGEGSRREEPPADPRFDYATAHPRPLHIPKDTRLLLRLLSSISKLLRGRPASAKPWPVHVAPKIGCVPGTLNDWVERAEVDSGVREGITTSDAQRVKELEREVRELRKANEILKLVSAFFARARLANRPLRFIAGTRLLLSSANLANGVHEPCQRG